MKTFLTEEILKEIPGLEASIDVCVQELLVVNELDDSGEIEQALFTRIKAELLTKIGVVTPKTYKDQDVLRNIMQSIPDPDTLSDADLVKLHQDYGFQDANNYKDIFADHSMWILKDVPNDWAGCTDWEEINVRGEGSYWDAWGKEFVDAEEALSAYSLGNNREEEEEEMYPKSNGSNYHLWTGDNATAYKGSTTKTKTTASVYSGGGTADYVSKKQCPTHGGSNIVFSKTVNGKIFKFAGAQGAHVDIGSDLSLVVDFAGQFKQPDKADVKIHTQNSPSVLDALADTIPFINTIRVKWPDYGVPSVHYQFWKTLWKCLEDDSIPGGRIVLCCIGGHGRTGTGLASMYLTQPLNKKKRASTQQAIDFIRNNHCGNAIESPSQEKYLKEIWEAAISDVTQ